MRSYVSPHIYYVLKKRDKVSSICFVSRLCFFFPFPFFFFLGVCVAADMLFPCSQCSWLSSVITITLGKRCSDSAVCWLLPCLAMSRKAAPDSQKQVLFTLYLQQVRNQTQDVFESEGYVCSRRCFLFVPGILGCLHHGCSPPILLHCALRKGDGGGKAWMKVRCC